MKTKFSKWVGTSIVAMIFLAAVGGTAHAFVCQSVDANGVLFWGSDPYNVYAAESRALYACRVSSPIPVTCAIVSCY